MASWLERTRFFLSDNAEYLLVGFVVLVAIGGVLAYEPYVDPGTEIEEFEESSWSSTAAYTHQATVTEQTAVLDQGQVLRNRAAYFESISPVLNGTFSYSYAASDAGELTVDADIVLILRSANEDGREYWREESLLTSSTEESVQPGEDVTVPFSVNVTEANQRIDLIEGQLGGTPGTAEVVVESRLLLSGERNGEQVETRSQHQIVVVSQDNIYSVEGDQPDTDSGQQFGRETVEASYGTLRTVGAPLLFVLSILGIGGVTVGRRRGWFSVSDRQREWMAYQSTRSEFDDWITDGTVPSELAGRTTVEVETLEGLVDIAIDSNRRVIADSSRGIYVVILEETIYEYELPEQLTNHDGPLAPGASTTVSETAGDVDDSDDTTESGATDGPRNDDDTAGSNRDE